jgi:hypothetical protein
MIPSPDEQAKILFALLARCVRLEADLHECREFLEEQMDVIDGDYGLPAPNRAMQLVNLIDETLHGMPVAAPEPRDAAAITVGGLVLIYAAIVSVRP